MNDRKQQSSASKLEKQDQYLRETFGLTDKEMLELEKEYNQRQKELPIQNSN